MIAVIDYGLGNIQAFLNIYQQLHIPVRAARSNEDFEGATKIILPGVGHFDYAMQRFNSSGMRSIVEKLVIADKVPVLGVCVGMQIMGDASEEGQEPGLGWIGGSVKSLHEVTGGANDFPLPHMGWNSVKPNHSEIFSGIDSGTPEFYFLHSYYFECLLDENRVASSEYCEDFCVAINNENIYGVQFHPEKSHHDGVRLLQNFAEMV
jgi:glutamine amidotransferase